MFSGTASAALTVLANIVAVLAIWLVKETSGENTPLALALGTVVVAGLTAVISFRAELGAILTSSGPWKLPRRLKSKWRYEDGSLGTVEIDDILEITQIGSLIRAKATTVSAPNAPFPHYKYSLVASINKEGVISGQWVSKETGRNYYGLLTLSITRDGEEFRGGWLGVGKTHVRSGQWVWQRDPA